MNRSAPHHTIVIGSSMAGLLAARVLADQGHQVTLLDRDLPGEDAAARRGVPQGQQPHVLLLRGKQILEELYPGLEAELLAQGALSGDMTGATRIVAGGMDLAKSVSGLPLLFASRPLIEAAVRRRTLALPNVRLLGGHTVQDLHTSADHRQVLGVQLGSRGGAETLLADLVVDASGRGSRTPAWLERLGYPRPPESRLQVNVTYTSRFYRRTPDQLGGDLMFLTFPEQPKDRRVMGCFAVEGGRWHVMLTGWHGEQAPAEDAGFLDFARAFEHPDTVPFLASLEPVSGYAVHRYPANVRRHYDQLKRFPEGLLVIGDALCSFNPSYAQGMTVAALQALALRAALHKQSRRPLWRTYFRATKRALDLPWSMVTGGDSSYPESQWTQPLTARLTGRYFNLIQRAARHDPVVFRTFFEVVHMVQPPSVFFAPAFIRRVQRGLRATGRAAGDPPSSSLSQPVG